MYDLLRVLGSALVKPHTRQGVTICFGHSVSRYGHGVLRLVVSYTRQDGRDLTKDREVPF